MRTRRIYYLFLENFKGKLLSLSNTSIISWHTGRLSRSFASDNFPVSVPFQFHNKERGRGTWNFNNCLLYQTDYVALVKNCIHEVCFLYSLTFGDEDLTFSITDHLLWEIIKKTNTRTLLHLQVLEVFE